jgi:hypothetical protein
VLPWPVAAAVFYQQRSTSAADPNNTYILEVRDANVTWTVYFTAGRLDGGVWTDKERSQHKEQLITVLKVSVPKLADR